MLAAVAGLVVVTLRSRVAIAVATPLSEGTAAGLAEWASDVATGRGLKPRIVAPDADPDVVFVDPSAPGFVDALPLAYDPFGRLVDRAASVAAGTGLPESWPAVASSARSFRAAGVWPVVLAGADDLVLCAFALAVVDARGGDAVATLAAMVSGSTVAESGALVHVALREALAEIAAWERTGVLPVNWDGWDPDAVAEALRTGTAANALCFWSDAGSLRDRSGNAGLRFVRLFDAADRTDYTTVAGELRVGATGGPDAPRRYTALAEALAGPGSAAALAALPEPLVPAADEPADRETREARRSCDLAIRRPALPLAAGAALRTFAESARAELRRLR